MPTKHHSARTLLETTPELKASVKTLAKANKMTTNAYIRAVLEAQVAAKPVVLSGDA